MYLNSWENVTLVCGNHGSRRDIPMILKRGPYSVFYSCPEYRSILGRPKEGRSCNNRLNLADYEELLIFLSERANDNDGMTEVNLEGLRWKNKGVSYEVISHKDDRFVILMRNDKAISG